MKRWLVGGAVMYVITVGGVYSFFREDSDARKMAFCPETGVETSVGDRQTPKAMTKAIADAIADTYDDKFKWKERILRVNSLRKKVTKKAKGRVLEVCTGTGKNFAYYDSERCTEVIAIDFSVPMLAEARRRAEEVNEETGRKFIRLGLADVEHLPYEDASFDTVIDTFGLCAVEHPELLLAEMQRLVRPDGQLLLLEHGLSSYAWLDGYLHRRAACHAAKFGCWLDRDVSGLLAASGWRVTSDQASNLGTFRVIEASPVPLHAE